MGLDLLNAMNCWIHSIDSEVICHLNLSMIVLLVLVMVSITIAEELIAYSTSWLTLDGHNREISGLVLLSNTGSEGKKQARGIIQLDSSMIAGETMQSLSAHVHDESCAFKGGKHWKFDETSQDSSISSEFHWDMEEHYHSRDQLWAMDASNPQIYFSSSVRSVVVHRSDGSKELCADLIVVSHKSNEQSFEKIKETSGVRNAFFSMDGTHKAIGYSSIWSDGSFTLSFLSFYIKPGITSSTPFAAHVHTGECSENGGPHWKNDPLSSVSDQTNEIHWILAKSEEDSANMWSGVSHSVHFAVSKDDRFVKSIVVHTQAGSKAVCIDMVNNHWNLKETKLVGFSNTWTSIDTRYTVNSGIAVLSTGPHRSEGFLSVELSPPPQEGLVAHVHNEKCSNGGGGHWKYDKDSPDSSTNNEFHWILHVSGNGRIWASHHTNWNVPFTSTIKSVVIHLESGPKLVCADLTVQNFDWNPFSVAFRSNFVPLVSLDGVHWGSGYASIWSTASSTYSFISMTITPNIQGSESLVAHIHADVCKNNGGGHWKHDEGNLAVDQSNEFHYVLSSLEDDSHSLHAIVRNDNFGISFSDKTVQSIVVHNPDKTKSVCIDVFPCENCIAQLKNSVLSVISSIHKDWGSGAQLEYLFNLERVISGDNKVVLSAKTNSLAKEAEFYAWTFPNSLSILTIEKFDGRIAFHFHPHTLPKQWVVLYINLYRPDDSSGKLTPAVFYGWEISQFE